MNKTILAAIVIILLLAGAWYFFTRTPISPGGGAVSFLAEGSVVKDNPGLTPDVWHLVYETTGAPARTVELAFDDESRCGVSRALEACTGTFPQGQRAVVEGVQEGSVVLVRTLTYAEAPQETGMPITLYYYNPTKDTDAGGNILCSEKGLVAVERIIPRTTMPLTEAIKLLLRGEISPDEKARGVQSEFPLPGVALTNATVQNGMATLTFADPQHKTGGGSCRVGVLWAQIAATAKQFPTVQEVRFLPEELFQP